VDQAVTAQVPATPVAAAVVGAGPAGLMAAEVLAAGGVRVTVFDAMPSVGRKFLMAGRGGLNLTHSEALPQFLARYREAEPRLRDAIEGFLPGDLRRWSEALGETTFVGSSGRVFPRSFKASPLLRAWLGRLRSQGVSFALRHRFTGWDGDGRLMFTTPGGDSAVAAPAIVLALGGATWPRLGSDGGWVATLAARDVTIAPLRPSNCGFAVAWSELFRDRFEGCPLKGIALTFGTRTVRGEAVVTRTGIEGTVVYALSTDLREAIAARGAATVSVVLRPDLAVDDVAARLSAPRGRHSLANFLRRAVRLSPAAIGLVNEAAKVSGVALSALPPHELAMIINAVPLTLTATAPLAGAISTAGGISFDELDADYMIRRLPGVFAAGEMLDWEAPTGGYLLQGSFATGAAAGRGAVRWLSAARSR